MKHAFRLSRPGAAAVALFLLFGAFVESRAQTLSPTPDPFVTQITSTTIPFIPATPTPTASPTPTPSPSPTPAASPTPLPRDSFASGISGNGRFVVIESSGDISTERSDARNNRDGNQEIFLFDYAQRRIFQITNTRHALKGQTGSPIDFANVDVQIVNLRPAISHDGRFIVFISNAYVDSNPTLSPLNFNGNENVAGLRADANTEIFLYEIPPAPDVDLTAGTEVPRVDLAAGTMTRITFTPASRPPQAGSATTAPFFARDNDAPAVNDNGNIIAFVSQSRSGIPGSANADGNPEIFIFNRTGSNFLQVTNTADKPPSGQGLVGTLVFNTNPSLSGSGGVLAFESNADINSGEAAADQGNGEIYVANFNGTAVSNLRPVTRTPPERREGFVGVSVNILSPGRRLSRDGNFLAFESTANFNADGSLSGSLANTYGMYVYNVGANTFAQIANRVPDDQRPDLALRFPTFTGDSTRVVWASDLNLRPDGTVAAPAATDGLNPDRLSQIFSAPVGALNQVSRLTRNPAPLSNFAILRPAIQPLPSDTVRRVAFSLTGTELGGGNADGFSEAFYLLIPPATSEAPSSAAVSFFTGASDRPVVAPSPQPSPPAVTGLAPGMLGIARSAFTLAPVERQVNRGDAHETLRRPPLPVELGGVSVSVNNAAAGLYSVAPGQINFVVPPGLAASATALPVVINNNGAVVRTTLLLNPAQPDIFTSTNGAGGRAAALNSTNPCTMPTAEPFSVTTTRPAGSASGDCSMTGTETVPTELLFLVTGVRTLPSGATVTVRIGTTDLTGTAIVSVGPSLTPGFDQVIVRLPESLRGAGDVPVVISVTVGGTTFTSRPAESAPRITILP